MSEDKTFFLNDIPEGDDSFEIHTNIALTIANIIEKMEVAKNYKSFTLGLFGDWGSGKSFIVNKIENILKHKEDIVFLNIDVWKFVGNPLSRSILFDIEKQLTILADNGNKNCANFKGGFKDELKKTLQAEETIAEDEPLENIIEEIKNHTWVNRNYYLNCIFIVIVLTIFINSTPILINFIKHLLSLFYTDMKSWYKSDLSGLIALLCVIFTGLGVIFAPFIKPLNMIFYGVKIRNFKLLPNFSPEQFEETLENQIIKKLKNNPKIVIVFDNLDRCEPHLAYETLSTIKTFMDKDNCFYIIPCDDEAIKDYLQRDLFKSCENNNGKEFIDKIFNVYFRIPKLKEADRDNFIEEQLNKIKIKDEISLNINAIKQILFFAYKGLTPRQIKRFINDFALYFYLAKNADPNKQFLLNDINFFAVMIAIKQKWPDFEKELSLKPKLIENFYKDPEFYLKDEKNKDVFEFLQNVKSIVGENKPLYAYIHFKESHNEQEIMNLLRNGQVISAIDSEKQYSIQTAINVINQDKKNNKNLLYFDKAVHSLFYSIKNYYEENNPDVPEKLNALLNELLFQEDWNFKDFIFNIINDIEYLFKIMKDYKVKEKDLIEKKILKSFYEGNISLSKNEELFEKIIENNIYTFEINNIQDLFNNEDIAFNIDKHGLEWRLIGIICEKEKFQLVPNSLLEKLIEKLKAPSLDEEVIELLHIHWHKDNLPDNIRALLSQKIVENSISINENPNPMLNDKKILLNLIKSINLVFESDFNSAQLETLRLRLKNICQSLSNHGQHKLSGQLAVESIIFYDDQSSLPLVNLFKNTALDYLIDNIHSYSLLEKIFKLNNMKKSLLQDNNNALKLYNKFPDEISQSYALFLKDPIDLENFKIFIQVNSNNANLDKKVLSEYILDNFIEKSDISQIFELFIILTKNGYPIEQEKIELHKNTLIDYYKKDPNNQINVISAIKANVEEDYFNNNFLKTIYNSIKIDLDAGNDVSSYNNIIQITESSFVKQNIDLIKGINSKLTETGQTDLEYIFNAGLMEKLNQIGKLPKNKEFRRKLKTIYNNFSIELRERIDKLGINFNDINEQTAE